MNRETHYIRRNITIIAAFVSAILMVVPPAIYFVMTYSHMAGELDAEGEINRLILQVQSPPPDRLNLK